MVLVIGPLTPEKEAYIKNIDNAVVINNLCKLDKNQVYNVVLINPVITNIGLVKDTEILLDELFITFKVSKVFCNQNNDRLLSYCTFYGVRLIAL